MSLNVKTMEGWKVGVPFLVRKTLGVEGRVGVLGCELGKMTSGSIIHMDLHKLNNQLVSA